MPTHEPKMDLPALVEAFLYESIAGRDDCPARILREHPTPVVWASVGSGMRLGRAPAPDWATTAELLIGAGASVADAWLTGAKAPSPEVADLLREHGATPPT